MTASALAVVEGVTSMQPCLIIKLPGWYMGASVTSDSLTAPPVHHVAQVPDFPTGLLHSGHNCGESGGDGCRVAFSAHLPNGIQLSLLLDPHTICEVMAVPNTDGWKEVMDCEMENLRSHNIYKLIPCAVGIWTLQLGGVLHRKFKNRSFNRNKAHLVVRGNHQRPGIN